MSKEAVFVLLSQPSVKVKQVVLLFKVVGFVYLSMALVKVKQLVLLYQVIYFLAPNAYT